MGFLFADLNFSSVVQQPGLSACAAFTVNSQSVFKEDVDIVPTIIDDSLSYMPWGGDNQMPFDILSLIEKDETLATCQCFNAEVCYGSGLRYDTCVATTAVKSEVEDFMLYNDLAVYFIGVNQEFVPFGRVCFAVKYFGFTVPVFILNEDVTKMVSLKCEEVCYCQFVSADSHGKSTKSAAPKSFTLTAPRTAPRFGAGCENKTDTVSDIR